MPIAALAPQPLAITLGVFTASLITPATHLYDNLLVTWPRAAFPHHSLILLSRAIETHLRPFTQNDKTDYLGITLTTEPNAAQLPQTLLYDLETAAPHTDDFLLPDHPLWVGYTLLENRAIDQYLLQQKHQETALTTDTALTQLQTWHKNFTRTLATLSRDLSQSISDPMALGNMLRALNGLTRQAIILQTTVVQARTQPLDHGTPDLKSETQIMRAAITQQLANPSLPESTRAALRHSLSTLRIATNDHPVPPALLKQTSLPVPAIKSPPIPANKISQSVLPQSKIVSITSLAPPTQEQRPPTPLLERQAQPSPNVIPENLLERSENKFVRNPVSFSESTPLIKSDNPRHQNRLSPTSRSETTSPSSTAEPTSDTPTHITSTFKTAEAHICDATCNHSMTAKTIDPTRIATLDILDTPPDIKKEFTTAYEHIHSATCGCTRPPIKIDNARELTLDAL